MSGGAWDFLCRQLEDEHDQVAPSDLEKMADRVAELGGVAVASEMRALAKLLEATWQSREAAAKRLAPVMRAVEWHDSGDTGISEVQAALFRYSQLPQPERQRPQVLDVSMAVELDDALVEAVVAAAVAVVERGGVNDAVSMQAHNDLAEAVEEMHHAIREAAGVPDAD